MTLAAHCSKLLPLITVARQTKVVLRHGGLSEANRSLEGPVDWLVPNSHKLEGSQSVSYEEYRSRGFQRGEKLRLGCEFQRVFRRGQTGIFSGG